MKTTDLALRLSGFLNDYLPGQRNLSPNTIQGYRDAFVLLFHYCRDVEKMAVDRLRLVDLQPPLILGFLDHLEQQRACSGRTRNHRLAALHSFFRYVQLEEPELIHQCQRILAIPLRRTGQAEPLYLTMDDLAAILKQPDLSTPQGRRDVVLLSLMYDTGARVQEVLDLCVDDLRLSSPAQVRITGKGRKMRIVPLMRSTAHVLREYLQEHGLDCPGRGKEPVFVNARGRRLSRWGVRFLLRKYCGKARSKRPDLASKISPHTLRHTKAMHLVQSGNPAVVVRDILGHADIQSTQIYARADLEMKRRALEKTSPVPPRSKKPSWQRKKGLLDWLRSL